MAALATEKAPGRLAGKVCIVTGAGRGLGQYCAFAFAREGARVALLGRNTRETGTRLPGNVNLTAALIHENVGSPVLPLICDVADLAAVEATISRVLEEWGQIDVLMNNAAYTVSDDSRGYDLAPRQFDRMLRVNVGGPFNLMHCALPEMKRRKRGSIINVSGRSVRSGSPLESTKAALEVMTIGLARELHEFNVAVNALRPAGFIETPGVLINSDVKDGTTRSPNSYIAAALLLAEQSADTYTGQAKNDAEVMLDLADPGVFEAHAAMNPPSWRASAALAA